MSESDPPQRCSDPHEAARQLVRSIVGFPELAMRTAWIAERFEGKSDEWTAKQLDQVSAWSQLSHDDARETMLALSVLMAQRRDSAWLWALYHTAKQYSLINLERVLRPASNHSPLSRDHQEPPVPDYGVGRPLSVGERKSIARRPTRRQLERLLHDPHPLVIDQLLKAPGLTEEDVVTIATRRPAYVPALELLIESPRWIIRRRVRLSLVLNPGCPHGLAVPFLVTFPREDLKLIVETTTTSVVLRSIAHELYLKLPPLQEGIQLEGLH